MNAIKKVILSSVTAAAIGGGTWVATELADTPEEVVDDVTAATVTVPKIELPKVELPRVDAETVVRVEIRTPEISGVTILPTTAAVYHIPGAELAESSQQELIATAQTATASTGTAQTATAQNASVQIPLIASGAARIPQIQSMLRDAKSLLADQRNLRYDPDFGLDSKAWQKWLEIYRRNEPYTLEYKPLSADLRIIAEVKCPVDADQVSVLDKNLEFYAKRGYNAVLLTFDTTEDLPRLIDTAELIRAHGLKIVCAYAGPEKLNWSVFRDPDVIAEYISRICAVSDAFLIGWRRTSCHLLIQDDAFRNHLLRSARKLNPQIPVIGEAYYGQTAHSDHRTDYVSYNVPANASAVLLFGIGYKGVAIELAMDGMFPAVRKLPRIGLAIGEKPYFDSSNDTGKSYAQNLAIKQRIERRFRAGGCVGTMTIRGDGSDGIYDKSITENLSLPYGKEVFQ